MKKIILLSCLVLLILITNIARASLPGIPPDSSWFKVLIEFKTTDLPQGVSIIKDDYKIYDSQLGQWGIKNDSTTPLYFFKKKVDHYDDTVKINVFPELKVPTDLVSIYKLVSGEVYYPRSTFINRGNDHDLEGKFYVAEKLAVNCGENKNNCLTCPENQCDPSIMVIYSGILYGMGVNPTKNIYQENRSANPTIPLPEDFNLPVYYGNKATELKGRFIYSLNDNYGKGGTKSVDYDDFRRIDKKSNTSLLVKGITQWISSYKESLIGVGAFVLLGLVWIFIRKPRD